jgi:hypothetical protein
VKPAYIRTCSCVPGKEIARHVEGGLQSGRIDNEFLVRTRRDKADCSLGKDR